MHKRSEYLLIYIEIIISVLIGLISLVYELSNNAIENHKNEIIIKSVELSHIQNLVANSKFDINKVQFDIVNKVTSNKELGDRPRYADDEIYNIRRAYFNGSIDQNKFNELEYDYQKRKVNEYSGRYNTKNEQLESLVSKEPYCWHIRCNSLSSILNLVRILLTFSALGLFFYLLKIMHTER